MSDTTIVLTDVDREYLVLVLTQCDCEDDLYRARMQYKRDKTESLKRYIESLEIQQSFNYQLRVKLTTTPPDQEPQS